MIEDEEMEMILTCGHCGKQTSFPFKGDRVKYKIENANVRKV